MHLLSNKQYSALQSQIAAANQRAETSRDAMAQMCDTVQGLREEIDRLNAELAAKKRRPRTKTE